MRIHQPTSAAARTQAGSALVISLILLLVLTVLGITSMNTSVIQELMSGAYRGQTEALANTELVVADAEDRILDIVAGNFTPGVGDGFYHVANNDLPPVPIQRWEDFPARRYATNAAPAGEYVIEYLGRREIPGESISIGEEIAGSAVSVFRISARSTGDRGARRIVQSVFVTLQDPDNPVRAPGSDDPDPEPPLP